MRRRAELAVLAAVMAFGLTGDTMPAPKNNSTPREHTTGNKSRERERRMRQQRRKEKGDDA